MVRIIHVLVMGNGYGKPPGKMYQCNVSRNKLCVLVSVFSTNPDPLQPFYNNKTAHTVLLLPFIDKKMLNRQTGPK